MKTDGQRLQVRVGTRKVTGFWNGHAMSTRLHGEWVTKPADSLNAARDALHLVHATAVRRRT